METLIEDFSIGLFLWQFFIFVVLTTFCYIVFKMIMKFLRKKT
ncbi:hypothetical protein FSS13T_23990 [Flavobacterium saliperosum S13]|uniref:Uncharacterized protein n=2 Tax=Flavobacterium saliperosum TaxID=329186 RepID=A0A1G4W7I4_9FLAO|nr:hypothetical protein FSS13T_23990 [Flavobacterium saliperosum S13]SCX17973.1 hypothetical protein SAMN02927925_02626 [Flavobacterium saliperosum]